MEFSVGRFQEKDKVVLTPSFARSAKDLYGDLSAMLHNSITAFGTAGAGIIALHDHISVTSARLNLPVFKRELTGVEIV